MTKKYLNEKRLKEKYDNILIPKIAFDEKLIKYSIKLISEKKYLKANNILNDALFINPNNVIAQKTQSLLKKILISEQIKSELSEYKEGLGLREARKRVEESGALLPKIDREKLESLLDFLNQKQEKDCG